MAMATMGSSCRAATLGSLSLAAPSSVAAPQRSSVSLRSAFVGLRLQSKLLFLGSQISMSSLKFEGLLSSIVFCGLQVLFGMNGRIS